MPEKFRNIDRTQSIMIDADFKSFLTKDSLACYTMDIVEQLNLTSIEGAYSFIGNKAYPPKMRVNVKCSVWLSGIFIILFQFINFMFRNSIYKFC
jgi:hypothetical protein